MREACDSWRHLSQKHVFFLPVCAVLYVFSHKIIGEAVDVEKAFICDALPVSLIGMNSDLMREYIEYCADR